jgi:UDP-2-acetamido-2,6-beta-L-arabino-hexul-4-ose reductase
MIKLDSIKVLITGSEGFIGKNLTVRLKEHSYYEIFTYTRGSSDEHLTDTLLKVDVVVHLAGENRPDSPELFNIVNAGLTDKISKILTNNSVKIPIIFASSSHATSDNAYGHSKLAAEKILQVLSQENGNPILIYRLPGVFGKWCRPDYNSVVATFCHNVVNGLPLQISDENTNLRLVYIDDVIASIQGEIENNQLGVNFNTVKPEYEITLGDLSKQINAFKNCRTSLVIESVGVGLVRALYATYVSHLPCKNFSYQIPSYNDERGIFVEMLKTPNSGQFSYFTAHPGITRGGHYHHTKTEKFLVIKGYARFNFRQIVTNERYTITTSGVTPEIVETVPGWVHDVTNIGDEEMIVMLWANENFDRQKPDTITSEV